MYGNNIALRMVLSISLLISVPQVLAQRQKPISEVVLDSGITLKDWVQLPTVRESHDQLATSAEAARYVRRYGPYRELLGVVEKASRITSLNADSITRENAQSKVLELRSARALLGDWPDLLMASAIAEGMIGDRNTALTDLKIWLRTVPENQRAREQIVALLNNAQKDPHAIDSFVARHEEADEELKRALVRPLLPVEIAPALWEVVQQSDAYRHGRKVRKIVVSSVSRQNASYASSTSEDLIKTMTVISPVGERCTKIRKELEIIPISSSSKPKRTSWHEEYYCGGIIILNKSSTGVSSLKQVTKLDGTLFPPAIGAREEVELDLKSDSTGDNWHISRSCRITERIEIGMVDSKLTGNAWKLSCTRSSYIDKKDNKVEPYQDVLLEDLGLRRSDLVPPGGPDEITLPSPGYRSIRTTSIGGDEYKSNIVYDSFTWTVDPAE